MTRFESIINYILSSDIDASKRVINFIDIDDTLFKTGAKVKVLDKDGNVVTELNSEEFNTYKLKPGEHYDFSNFLDSDIFFNTAKPIKSVLDKINMLLNNARNNRIIFLTARADMKDKQKFLDTFRKYGIPVDNKNIVYIERAGNLNLKPSEAKKIIVRKYITNSDYDIVRLIDDSEDNLSKFLELREEFPDKKFEAIRVTKDGKMVKYNK